LTAIRLPVFICAGFLLSIFLPPLYALDERGATSQVGGDAAKLVGVWEIMKTKEPGKPYLTGFQGRPFVTKGPNSFTLIMEYHRDGTFRRLLRVGGKEIVQNGHWILSGHELRQRAKGKRNEEVMYLRFDQPDRYTSIEVFEDTSTPGLFAQFKKTGTLAGGSTKAGSFRSTSSE